MSEDYSLQDEERRNPERWWMPLPVLPPQQEPLLHHQRQVPGYYYYRQLMARDKHLQRVLALLGNLPQVWAEDATPPGMRVDEARAYLVNIQSYGWIKWSKGPTRCIELTEQGREAVASLQRGLQA